MPFKCGTCDAEFRSRVARQRHFDDVGHRPPAHECPAPTCAEFRDDGYELWRHMEECPRLEKTKFNGMHWTEVYEFYEDCDSIFDGSPEDVRAA